MRGLLSAPNAGLPIDALNSELALLRSAPISREAVWRGVVARAENVLTDGQNLAIVVTAAKVNRVRPSDHDVLHARLCAFVFRKSAAQSFETVRVLLHALHGPYFEVTAGPLPEKSVDQILDRLRHRGSRHLLPAPVVCFLLRNELRVSGFCLF